MLCFVCFPFVLFAFCFTYLSFPLFKQNLPSKAPPTTKMKTTTSSAALLKAFGERETRTMMSLEGVVADHPVSPFRLRIEVCLFTYLFVCLLTCLFVCLFVYMFVCLFVYMFVCLFTCLFVCLHVVDLIFDQVRHLKLMSSNYRHL